MRMRPETQPRLDEIKRIWKPGISTRGIAQAVDIKVFGGKKPSRSAIIGLYQRYRAQFLHYPLPSGHGASAFANRSHKGLKAAREYSSEPKPGTLGHLLLRKPARSGPKLGRPSNARKAAEATGEPVEDRAPVARRADPGFTERQERRYRVEQIMLDREPIHQKHKAVIHKISLSNPFK